MKNIFWLLLFVSSLFAKDTITWIKWDLHPNFILEGDDKNQGWADKRLIMLQKKLPQYNHSSVVMNLSRAIKTYKNAENLENIYCTNDIISHSELDIDDYLSIGSFPFKAMYLVTSKNKAHLFGKKGQTIVLKDIIQNKNLRLAVSKNRPYLGAGKVLNEYLENNPNQTHINLSSTLNISKSVISSVFKNRADYTFEYINKVTYYTKELGFVNQAVVFPIKENEGVFYGFISCVKTKKGQKVIQNVNEIIRELKPTENWMKAFSNWMPNKELQEEYIKYYKEVFLPKGDIYDTNPRSQ